MKGNIQAEKIYLKAEAIHQFLTEENEALEKLIIFQDGVKKMTTDQSLYEAVAAIEDKGTINYPKLVKLLEVTEINSFAKAMNQDRKILKQERAKEIREKSGGNQNGR
jgi:tyrosyl-tRNA synthetase